MTATLMTIVVLGILILIHEFGHFLMARRVGIKVHEFAIGFGPKIYSSQPGETEYSLRLLPLGGYVRMAGMGPEMEEQKEEDLVLSMQELDEEVEPRRKFNNKTVLERMAVIGAGPIMNLLLAVFFFFLVFGVVGIQQPTLTVAEVKEGLPAEQSGLRPGDEILSVNDEPLQDWTELVKIIQANPEQPLVFQIERNGDRLSLQVKPVTQEDGTGFIGLAPEFETERLPIYSALAQSVKMTGAVMANFIDGIYRMIAGLQGPEIMGIVGIGHQIGRATRMGLDNLIFFTAALSATLGLVNLIPIPALDGSRLFFLLVEKIRGRRLDPAKENFIHFIGFALLILLAIFITYRDILRLT